MNGHIAEIVNGHIARCGLRRDRASDDVEVFEPRKAGVELRPVGVFELHRVERRV